MELSHENDTMNLDQYSKIMQLLDLNPKLAPVSNEKSKKSRRNFCS
jgi:hypothetical protein